jgi:hypothetical protein
MILLRHFVLIVMFSVAVTAWGQQPAPSDGSPTPMAHPVTQTIQGMVKFGNMAVPGVAVKVSDGADHQGIAWSDADGRFAIPFTGSGDAEWRVTAKMSGFVLSHKITFAPTQAPGPVELQLILASRAPTPQSRAAALAAAKANQDEVSAFDAAAQAPTPKAPAAASAGEGSGEMAVSTIAIPGALGKTAEAFTPQASVNRIHGALSYTLQGVSALDALPYAGLTGNAPAPPGHATNRLSGNFGGPLSIPHLYDDPEKRTTFSLDVFGQLASNLTDKAMFVPTAQERAGDFAGDNPIYEPGKGIQFPGNVIPQSYISPAAEALLNEIPLPNPNSSGAMNYVFDGARKTSVDSVSFDLTHAFGPALKARPGAKAKWRDNLDFKVNYFGSRGDLFGSLPALGGSYHWAGLNVATKYSISDTHWGNTLGLSVNGNQGKRVNQFAGTQDLSQEAGITGISENPADWGLPVLNFTNNYAALRDITPGDRHTTVSALSDSAWRKWHRHSVKFGGELQRRTIRMAYDANPNGNFTFDGFATALYDASGNQVSGTGNSFADFLLGDPQVATLQYGLSTYDFSNHSWNLYVNDNWKARKTLTLDLGLRYEYVSPYSEAQGHLVNLDANSDFTAVAPVFPGGTGLYHGPFPDGLVRPDYRKFAPAVGVAWKISPKAVLRTGYRIHYDPDQYARIVTKLAMEAPFMVSTTAYAAEPGAPTFGNITLQNAFSSVAPGTITNTYAVDPNYRMGYVQAWLLTLQYELFRSTVLNAGYNGAKGTHLDMVRVPDRNPDGTWQIPNVQPFQWETSQGASILHQGFVRLTQRMTQGLSADLNYTFGKSIDNASSIGGSSVVVAQNDHDLAAERGLSSFDIRQSLTGSYTYELPWGANKRWLNQPGLRSQWFGDLSWSGSFTIQSGSPFTANVTPNYTSVYQGASGSLRANYNGLPIQLSHPGIDEWFNTAAFSEPATGMYGDAGRNTIIGPGMINFNMTLAKNLRISEEKRLEFRITANNAFNAPHYTGIDTTVGDKQFGQVTSVGPMRAIVLYTGFKF